MKRQRLAKNTMESLIDRHIQREGREMDWVEVANLAMLYGASEAAAADIAFAYGLTSPENEGARRADDYRCAGCGKRGVQGYCAECLK